MTIRGRNLWLEGVIPLAVKIVSGDVKSLEFIIAHFDASRIGVGVLDGSDDQSFLGGGMRDELNDHFKRDQGLGTPVEGDVGEEPMFDLIPFTGSRRKMTEIDAESGLVGQPLHLTLPQATPSAVGSASISGDEQFCLPGIQALAMLIPPASDTLDGKLRRLMVNANIDKALIMDQVIHSIRDGFPIGQRQVVVDVNQRLFSFRLPLPPVVLEVSDQFLLLAIHRDDRITCGFKLLTLLLDVPKLGITVRVAIPLNGFLVRPQREAHRVQPFADSRLSQLMPLLLEGFLQLGYTFCGPSHQAHRIAFGLQQPFQIGLQARIVLLLLFSPSTFPSNPLSWSKLLAYLQLLSSRFNGIFGDLCLSGNQDNVPALFGFQRQKLPPLLLVEQLAHLPIFFSPLVLSHAPEYRTFHSSGQLIYE